MEQYYLCNFMDNELVRNVAKGIKKVSVQGFTEPVQLAEVTVNGECLEFHPSGVIAKDKVFDLLGNFSSKLAGCTDSDLKHTDENPIIVIATKSFKIFHGIQTYIKYLPLEEGVLIALIKGYIEVEGTDGSLVPLSRNCSDVVSSGKVYDAKTVKDLNPIVDLESRVKYSDYVVSDCLVKLDKTRDGSVTQTIKFNKDNFVFLNKEVFAEGKEERARELAKKEEERRRRIENAERFAEAQRLKALQKAEEEASKKAKSRKSKTSSKGKSSVETMSGSEGAKMFLDIVKSLK